VVFFVHRDDRGFRYPPRSDEQYRGRGSAGEHDEQAAHQALNTTRRSSVDVADCIAADPRDRCRCPCDAAIGKLSVRQFELPLTMTPGLIERIALESRSGIDFCEHAALAAEAA